MQNPPSVPNKWFSWADQELPSLELSSENNTVFFDSASRMFLDEALKLKLDRFTGWEIPKSPQAEYLSKAASVYKRGVAVKSPNGQNKEAKLSGSYPIEILGTGAKASQVLQKEAERLKPFIVMDKAMSEHWNLAPLKAHMLIDANEKDKSIDAVEALCQAAIKAGNPASWLIIGGGITGDAAAFAASIMQKPFTLVPTTLLAMADACVGGKTGVNAHPFGKNLIGSFAFPTKVLVIPEFLSSLSERVLKSGGAECLKHAFLAGKQDKAIKIATALKNQDLASLSEELKFVIELKAKIVAEDPTEKGKRAILNLGHTLAHALEAISHQNQDPSKHIHHGEAVAVGLAFCFQLSKHIIPECSDCIDEMIACLSLANLLPTKEKLEEHLAYELKNQKLWSQINSYLLNDKKKSDTSTNTCNWILLKSWGEIYSQNPKEFSLSLSLPEVSLVWKKFADAYDKL